MPVTYILFSATLNQFYVGSTSDSIEVRLRKHNSNHKGFTGGVGDWQITYTELFNSHKEALQREKQIKNWKSRKLIVNLIEKSKME